MLTECRSRCMLPAQDLSRARDFYETKLDLVAIEELGDGSVVYDAGGTSIMVFPGATPPAGHHTQLGFDVLGIRTLIEHLEHIGVEFEDYPMPGFKTEGHLVNIPPYWAAWFKDSEGNSLAMWEPDGPLAGKPVISLRGCTSETNLPTLDQKRARHFYEEKLGFSPLEEFGDGGVTYEAGGTQLIVSPTTVKPSQGHIQIAFETHDLAAEASVLSAAGVVRDGTIRLLCGMRALAFRDTEGNRLALVERLR